MVEEYGIRPPDPARPPLPAAAGENEVARWLLVEKAALARRVVARFYEAHPGLVDRWGERGRRLCLEDTEYHIHYLAVGVEYAASATFMRYVGWIRDILAARGIEPDHLALTLRLLREELQAAGPPGVDVGDAVALLEEGDRVLTRA